MTKSLTEVIKEAMTSEKIIIGSKASIKHLRTKELKLVVISTNCPANLKKDIIKYAELGGTKVETFNGTSKQLGVICGKPFPIAALSIK